MNESVANKRFSVGRSKRAGGLGSALSLPVGPGGRGTGGEAPENLRILGFSKVINNVKNRVNHASYYGQI